jgi:hypothetical protein
LVLAAALLAAGAASAQDERGTMRLRGQVLVEGGGPLAGANIRTDAIRGPGADQFTAQKLFTARTGRNGDWALLGVTRGLWIFEVSAIDHLPHVVLVPLSMMHIDPVQLEISLALQPVSAILPPGAPASSPARIVVEAAERLAGGDRAHVREVVQKLGVERMGDDKLDAAALCAAGDLALLVREPLLARRFFEAAAMARPDWYRPHLGVASAGLLVFNIDLAVKAYANARATTGNKRLQQVISAAIRDLQLIHGVPR